MLFCLMLTLACAIAPTGCIFPEENSLMATAEHKDPLGKRSFPPDADLRLNPDNGTIQYLKGKNLSAELGEMSSKGENPSDIALSFLDWYKTLFKLQQPHAELRCVAVQTDELGLKHVRFQQTYQAVPVWANELNVHLDRQNSVYLVQGRYIPTPRHINTQPAVSVRQAVERVFESLGLERKDVAKDDAELVIYVKPPGKALLAYRVPAPGWIYFVDAVNGDIVDRIATRHTGPGAFVPPRAEEMEKRG